MKTILLSIASTIISLASMAQVKTAWQAANYEAAEWKTKIVDKPILIAVVPSAAESKAELENIKKRIKNLDEKKLEKIRYWNAGAPAYRWNQLSPSLHSWEKHEVILRTPLSWMNLAIYDATILAWKEKLKYKRKRPGSLDAYIKPVTNTPATFSYPCEHSVTAAAAAYTLAYFFPEKGDSIMQLAKDASQSRIDAGVQFPSDVEAGWKLGEQVAKQVIEKAKLDGSDKKWDGKKNTDPKKWTGPFPLGITAATYTPIVMRSADQFRPAPPPDFEKEMSDLKNYKKNSRTTYSAYHWANIPMGFWASLAAEKMFEYDLMSNPPAAARIYATLHTGSHDAAIATMDAKYAYWGIRPSQYDTTYKPLLSTPPFPGYPSGHALGAATAGRILEHYFPADAMQFRKLAQECADSRFYAGIHFKTDNEIGLQMGNQIGKFVVESFIKDSNNNNVSIKK